MHVAEEPTRLRIRGHVLLSPAVVGPLLLGVSQVMTCSGSMRVSTSGGMRSSARTTCGVNVGTGSGATSWAHSDVAIPGRRP